MNDIASLCLSTIVPCVFLAGWVRCETVWALVLLVETSCVFRTQWVLGFWVLSSLVPGPSNLALDSHFGSLLESVPLLKLANNSVYFGAPKKEMVPAKP